MRDKSRGDSMAISRRVIGHSVLAVVLGSALAWAQAPSTSTAAVGSAAQAPARGQGPEPARGGRGGGRGPAQGGTGPLKVMFVSKGHPFDREGLFSTLDALGTDITWTHVEQPAAELYLDPKNAGSYDVLLFYDLDGSQPDRKHTVTGPDGTTKTTWDPPPAELQKSFKALLQSGKGIVFLHHSIASWVHAWPEYVEAMGGACDWFAPLGTIRGLDYPRSGAFGRTKQHVTVVDKTHPIVQGLGDGFDIVDEAYSCPMFEESVHPLLRTDFAPADHDRNLNPKMPFSNLSAWVKTAENSPIAYIQHGHDITAWENPQFRLLLLNALKWAASPDAKTWAKAHPTKIFK
jgi:type 1 glutamine amidotransferase